MRENIESEMPLEDAIADFNEAYPDANPLTVGEVVASIRHMRSVYPDMSDAMFELYQSVADRKVLPKGMYFSRMTRLTDGDFSYGVVWMDLTWTALPNGESDPVLGSGFNHRVRARFVSSRELSEEEKANQERARVDMVRVMKERIRELQEEVGGLSGEAKVNQERLIVQLEEQVRKHEGMGGE